MTPLEYRTAIATLGLSQLAAGRWLGVSPKTAQRYATDGPSGAAARAVGLAVAMVGLEREGHVGWGGEIGAALDGPWVRHSDLIAALDLPTK